MLGLITYGRQDIFLTPASYLMKLWELTLSDIRELDTWQYEYIRIITLLENYARMPNVLCNIIISYSGPAYSDTLVDLGKSPEFYTLVNDCKSRGRSSLQSAQMIITSLAKKINMPVPTKYSRGAVRNSISNINKFNTYPTRARDLKRCAVFHQLLLTYF